MQNFHILYTFCKIIILPSIRRINALKCTYIQTKMLLNIYVIKTSIALIEIIPKMDRMIYLFYHIDNLEYTRKMFNTNSRINKIVRSIFLKIQ